MTVDYLDEIAVLENLLRGAQSLIQSTPFYTVSGANVVILEVPLNRPQDLPETLYPSIVLAPLGPEEMAMDGTNSRDDITYPVLCAVVAANRQDQRTDRNLYFLWRQKLRRMFHNNGATVAAIQQQEPTLYTVAVKPYDIIDARAWMERSLLVSALLLRFSTREPRTV